MGVDRYPALPPYAQLTKAVADARAVRDLLRGSLKFDHVEYSENPTLAEAKDRLDAFARRLQKGDVAFVFLAGHGANVRLANYLLPSDLPPMRDVSSEAQVRLEEESMIERSISEERIRDLITLAGARAAIVVLDACRNNVFREMLAAAGPRSRTLAAVSHVQGPRPIDRPRTQGQTQFLTLYSASPGQRALDSLGPADRSPNSPFTRVLVEHLPTPDRRVYEILRGMRAEVARLAAGVGHDQVPAITDEAIEEVVLVGTVRPATAAPPAPVPQVSATPPAPVTPAIPVVSDPQRPAPTDRRASRPLPSTPAERQGLAPPQAGDAWTGWRLTHRSNVSIPVNAVARSPDWRLGAASYRDGAIRLWSLADGRLAGTIGGSGDSRTDSLLTGLVFNPSGQLLAASSGGEIQIWSTATLKRQLAFSTGSERVTGLAFSEDGSAIVARAGRGAIRAFDLATRQERVASPADAALLTQNARRPDRASGWSLSSSGGSIRLGRGRRGNDQLMMIALAGGGWIAIAEDGLSHAGTSNATAAFELVKQRDRLPITDDFVRAYFKPDGLR